MRPYMSTEGDRQRPRECELRMVVQQIFGNGSATDLAHFLGGGSVWFGVHPQSVSLES